MRCSCSLTPSNDPGILWLYAEPVHTLDSSEFTFSPALFVIVIKDNTRSYKCLCSFFLITRTL